MYSILKLLDLYLRGFLIQSGFPFQSTANLSRENRFPNFWLLTCASISNSAHCVLFSQRLNVQLPAFSYLQFELLVFKFLASYSVPPLGGRLCSLFTAEVYIRDSFRLPPSSFPLQRVAAMVWCYYTDTFYRIQLNLPDLRVVASCS